MSTRKYQFEPLTDADIDALREKYPTAVETRTVMSRKPIYKVIAMLLDCGLEVPGVRLVKESYPPPASDIAQATTEAVKEQPPVSPEGKRSAFHEKLHSHQV